MKILHTSDWHLGHTLYGYDRSEEQNEMLRQIEELVGEERPDALVVSGDIFHTGQPSAAVQTLFTDAVMRMHAASPDTVIVITAGNHDSASRHEITRILWQTQQVHMIGTVDKERLVSQVVDIQGKGYVVAIPYLNERSIPEGFWQSLSDGIGNGAGLPLVLSAHLTVNGSDFSGHEDARDRTVGGIDAIDLEALGTGFDYVALGHIHRPQTLRGSDGRVRYCGTPVPVSFDECFPHTVSVVEIAAHGAKPAIREITVSNPRPLVSLPTEGFASWEKVQELAKNFPKDNPAYIRLRVEVEDILPPDAQAMARNLFAEGNARFCYLQTQRKAKPSAAPETLSVSEFRAMDPLDVARLFAGDTGMTFDDKLEGLFREAAAAAREEHRNQ